MWTATERPALQVAALRRELLTPVGDYTALDVVAETGSTNADLAAVARSTTDRSALDRTVLVAEHQSAGRGRNARAWLSPPRAGLSLSVLLRPAEVPVSRWGWLPLLAGVALVEAVRATTGVDAALKWPNDLLVDGRKCAGILAEVVNGAEPVAVVGIGLNVDQRAAELPPGVDATSIALSGGAGAAGPDRGRLLVAVLGELAGLDRRWRSHGGDPAASGLREAYRERCATIGRRIRVTLPDDAAIVGTATDVDRDGRLVVDDGAREHRVSAGDVVHVRGAGHDAAT